MKGMDEFLDVEAEPSDGDDFDDDADDDATTVGDVPAATRGDDALIQSPSPKIIGRPKVSRLKRRR